ncbi:MAG TPA: hypothetical protein V6D17_12750 [Candidatus Obscuribacterales bacterium]
MGSTTKNQALEAQTTPAGESFTPASWSRSAGLALREATQSKDISLSIQSSSLDFVMLQDARAATSQNPSGVVGMELIGGFGDMAIAGQAFDTAQRMAIEIRNGTSQLDASRGKDYVKSFVDTLFGTLPLLRD